MFKTLVYFYITFAVVTGQTWINRANLRNHTVYWQNLMQEMIYQVEAREWCNLKPDDITQTIDDNLFNMRVTGTVEYTNGFVVSIQKIEIVDIEQLVTSQTIDGEPVAFGTVRGKLSFRDLMLGYDVYANLTSPAGEHRATGTFLHNHVQINLDLTQNLKTKELTTTPSVRTVTFGSGVRMQYMPASHVTQAISRRFWHNTFESAGNWARNIFGPLVIDIATNKLGFPEVCFSNCF